MIRLITLSLVACLSVCATSAMTFINPPPSGEVGDWSSNPTYSIGSSLKVEWTAGAPGTGVSISLWQFNKTDRTAYFGEGEYLIRSAVDETEYNWRISTTKNLTTSDVFALYIFQEGSMKPDSNSHYFVLQEGPVSQSSTAVPSTSSSTPTATTGGSISSPTAAGNQRPEGDQSNSSSSGGLSTSAKIGIGLGIPLAALLGLVLGLLLFRRRKNNKGKGSLSQQQPYSDHPNQRTGTYYGTKMTEGASASRYSPVESGGAFNSYYHPKPDQSAGYEPYREPTRFELP